MNKKFFLLLFIFGFHPQFSFAINPDAEQLANEEPPEAIVIEIDSLEGSTLVDELENNSELIELEPLISSDSSSGEPYPGPEELSLYQNIIKRLQELNISNNLNHLKIKFHSDLAPFLKKALEDPRLLLFLTPTSLLYEGSRATHLLENYFPSLYAKIISNSLKTFYMLGLYYYLEKDGGLERLSFKEIMLLFVGHCLIAFLA